MLPIDEEGEQPNGNYEEHPKYIEDYFSKKNKYWNLPLSIGDTYVIEVDENK